MKELIELVYIIDKSTIEIFPNRDVKKKELKLIKLYDLIVSGEVKNDKEASYELYGKNHVTGKYRNLKHQLKKKLLDLILWVDDKGMRSKRSLSCHRRFVTCLALFENSGFQAAVKEMEKILPEAIELEILDLVMSISLNLRIYYGLRKIDKKKFRYYNSLYNKYQRIEHYKNKAHEYYLTLLIDYGTGSVMMNSEVKRASEKYYNQLSPYKEEIQLAKFHHYLYQIQLVGAMGVFDYQCAIHICEEAIHNLYQSNENSFVSGKRNFLLNKLVCHIQLNQFSLGKQAAEECEKIIDKGSYIWFKAKQYFFQLSIHTANYQETYETYRVVTEHPRYSQYQHLFEETWQLYRMYLHFLYLLGKIEVDKGDKTFTKVRLGRFLNEVPKFSKDKTGMNIPVLIIQFAILLLQKKYEVAEERVDALKKYCARYLKKENPNYRCNCFIKLLIQIPTVRFRQYRIETRAQKYLDKMREVDINFSNQAHEVEILPFETMWNYIYNALYKTD